MLQIDVSAWRETLADYARAVAAAPGAGAMLEVDDRLRALADAYTRHSPHATPLPDPLLRSKCPACELGAAEAVVARLPGPLVFGRCADCGHGLLLSRFPSDAELRAVYADGSYYVRRTEAGVGYDAYEAERSYREAKAEALFDRILRIASGSGATIGSVVEVGSGFGFARAAAEHREIRTLGVDLNPEAARAAKRLYGLATFTGTLDSALVDPSSNVRPGASDLALYQFVLEHVTDPVRELEAAARALRPQGFVALLVPSMEARELEVFGASYRSLRADHLHLFSRDSIARVLGRAGFEVVALESGCSVHLLRGFLSEAELESLYGAGSGPDLFVMARLR